MQISRELAKELIIISLLANRNLDKYPDMPKDYEGCCEFEPPDWVIDCVIATYKYAIENDKGTK